MLRILHGTNYDFIKWWKHMAGITVVWILIGVALFLSRGAKFNTSIEFTGGTLVQLQFAQPTTDDHVRAGVEKAGYPHAEIQQFGSPTEYTVRARPERGGTITAASSDSTGRQIERAL